jgi:hypothetical protein
MTTPIVSFVADMGLILRVSGVPACAVVAARLTIQRSASLQYRRSSPQGFYAQTPSHIDTAVDCLS